MKSKYVCEHCGKEFYKYPSQQKGKQHYFCSQACLAEFRKNGGYPKTEHPHLSEYNRQHNAERMTPEVRAKLRAARLSDNPDPQYYKKIYGQKEHRLVAEQMIGRKLRPGEVVHHINFDRHDNRPENLMVFSSSAEHLAWHRKHDPRFKTRKKEEVMPS